MIRIFTRLFLLFLLAGCSNYKDQEEPVSTVIGNTDSLVVKNLINRSLEGYNNSLETVPLDDFLKEAEVIAKNNNDEIQLSEIYCIVGKRYRNKSLYQESILYLKKAVEIAERLNRKDLLSEYYNQLGVVYRRLDQNPIALDYHLEAMRLAEALNDSFNIEVALNSIGNINLNMKRYHAGIEYFIKSIEISKNENNNLGMAINSNNLGEAFLGLNEPDSALHYFFQSLDYNKKINSLVGESICYNSIGDAYVAKGHLGLAQKYLKKALDINRQMGDKLNLSVSYTHLGETYMLSGDYQKAINYVEKGLKIGKDIGSLYQTEEALNLLSKINEFKGNYEEALAFLKQSNFYKDSLINEKNIHYVSTMETFLESEKQSNKIAALSQEKVSQEVKIKQQRIIIITIVLLVLVLAFSIVLIVFQNRLRSRYKTLKYQQQLLRTQMNPHFIFNVLSAIQVFILENDKEKAASFLSEFAKLMRQVLRSSNYEYISLRDEIDIVNYYLSLQQLRFENPFEYRVDVDKHLDLDFVMVPPMLTQPFIENAIQHGFSVDQENAILIVRFQKEDNNLVIEVDDNGSGIDSVVEYKKKAHDSMAIKITKARLEILKKARHSKVTFTITDKKRIRSFDQGTLVRFVLPLIISEEIK